MLSSAVAAVIDSTLPGAPAVSAMELDKIERHAPAALRTADADAAGRAAAALIWAHVRAGHVDDAITLSRTVLASQQLTHAIDDRTMEDILITSASAYAAVGRTPQSTPLALRALDYASHRDDAAAVFRAHSVLALSRALNGEYTHARESIRHCALLRRQGGWSRSVADYPLLVSQTLCASAALDVPELRQLADQLRAITPKEPLWELTARLADAMALLIRNDLTRALSVVVSVLNSSDRYSLFDVVRGFAAGIHADVLLARGDARRALAFLENWSSPEGHALCFDMQRASAHLLLEDSRQALRVTDGCIRLGSEHCLRTVPPVLLRRAVAHERLGRHDFADESFEEAFHLVMESGSSTPLLTLPRAELAELLDRLALRRPEHEPQIAALSRRLDVVPSPDRERPRLAPLTRREQLLADHLRSNDPYPMIASQLHVSVATVRSQAHSIYSKLAVRSRDDAVAALELAGFYI